MIRLSIIVPVYNMASEGKLEYCLNSLVNQKLDNGKYEIIAVDDCSTDNSLEILRSFAEKYPDRFIALHSKVNHHQGGAKNLGLAIARGEWLGFIDSDDWIVPDYYNRLLNKAEETGADMVGCDYCFTDEHSFKVGQIVHNNNFEQTGVMNKERYQKLLLETGSLVVKVYRRELILGDYIPCSKTKLDIFPEDIFYEDNAISNTWMLRSRHFEYIQEPLYYYYQHNTSTVHSISRKNMEDRMTAGRLIVKEAKDNGYYEEYKPEIEYQFTVLFYINTLFSVMPRSSRFRGSYRFARRLAAEMRATFPEFQNNRYYQEKVHPEEKKLIRYQMKSHLFFYLYYRLLWFYRGLRSHK